MPERSFVFFNQDCEFVNDRDIRSEQMQCDAVELSHLGHDVQPVRRCHSLKDLVRQHDVSKVVENKRKAQDEVAKLLRKALILMKRIRIERFELSYAPDVLPVRTH